MDDTLYYVESPDSQVLGPMTMIHILEGIAAGVILESARVCEVGAREWIPLSELATTRDDGELVEHEAPASSFEHERVADVERPYGAPETTDEPSFAPAAEMTEWTPADDASSEEMSPESEEVLAADARTEMAAEPEAPARRFRDATAASSAAIEMPDLDGASDFALDMGADDADEEPEWVHAEDEEIEERGRPGWLVPVIAVLAVPIIAGVFFLTKGRDDSGARTGDPQRVAAPVSPLKEAADLLAAGRAKDAMGRYQQILSGEPDNAEAHHGLGKSAVVAGETETAVTHLERACELETGKPVWLADLSQALYDAGRTESAVQKISSYLAMKPGDRNWQLTRLDWMIAAGKESEAAKTYAELADERPEDAFFLYVAGLAQGEDRLAVSYLRKSVELDPANGDAQAAYGRALAMHGKTDQAIQALRKAFDIRPARPEEKALLASLEKPAPEPEPTPEPTTKPRSAAAPKVAPPAPARAPADLASRSRQVREALDGERFDRAGELLAQARAELGSSAEAERGVDLWEGIVAFEEGRFDEALAKFASLSPQASYRSTGADPGAAPNWIARVHLAKGDPREAVSALDAVGSSDLDDYAVARLWEGVALSALGMDDLAMRTWKRIPEDVGGRVGKSGRAAVESARFLTGAIPEADYAASVESTPGWENDVEFFRALAARRARDAEGARRHFERAVELSAGREFPYYLARAEISGDGFLER